VAEAGAGQDAPGPKGALMRDFNTLVGAEAVVSSVRGGWSAFPYAATRLSGAPLLVVEPLEESLVWRVVRAHSRVPIADVHHSPDGLDAFVASAAP
jgi:hypothetical protein